MIRWKRLAKAEEFSNLPIKPTFIDGSLKELTLENGHRVISDWGTIQYLIPEPPRMVKRFHLSGHLSEFPDVKVAHDFESFSDAESAGTKLCAPHIEEIEVEEK